MTVAGKDSEPSARIDELLCDPILQSTEVDVVAGEMLFDADTPAVNLYYIRSGQVRVFQVGRDRSVRLVEILGRGDWVGAPALAGSPAYGSRAVAVTKVRACRAPVDRLLGHIAHVPAVAGEVIRQLARKLQSAHQAAANLVFDDTRNRLIKALLQFSRTAAASPGENGEGVVLRITHQQLAQAVGAARETVSLTLTQLRQQKVLQTGRNRLLFDPAVLEAFARRAADKPTVAAAAAPAP